MADTPSGRPNSSDALMPKSPPSAPRTPGGSGGLPPSKPLKPRMADSPERPSDKRFRRGLLLASLAVGFFFILILVIAVLSSGEGSNTILKQIGVEGDINDIILKVVNLVFGIAGIIAIISVVIGGFIYVVSMRDAHETKRARRILLSSTIALLFLLFSYILIYTLIRTNQQAETPQDAQAVVEIVTNPSPATGAAPLPITFDVVNLASGNYFYSWDFGDTESGTGNPISHTFKREGNYIVKATVSSGTETYPILTTNVVVSNTRPVATIEADPIRGRAPLEVEFSGEKSQDPNGEITKYEWDFGDPESSQGNQNTAEGPRASHLYSRDGIYTVTLKVSDNNGDTGEMQQTIDVGAEPNAPIAVITTTPPLAGLAPPTIHVIAPAKVLFSGSKSKSNLDDTSTITKYEWDFGDGSPEGSGQAVEHTYTEPGTYEVELTVTNKDEKFDTAKAQVVVGSKNQAPTAVITSTPPANQAKEIRGPVPLRITLDGSKSTDGDGEITAYEWNLGDNSPLLNGKNVEYTYPTPGTYTLTLSVTDDDGYSNVETAQLKIFALQPGPQAPVSIIKTTPAEASGNIPFTVRFDGSDSYDSDGTILSYEWDFGDGASILGGAEVTHVYDDPCVCTVTLTVHDDSGLTGEGTKVVAAHIPAPVADISANKQSGSAPLTVRFDGSDSSGDIKRYDWNFGDGATARGRQVDHTFDSPGSYEVELVVTDTAEQVDDDTMTIEVR